MKAHCAFHRAVHPPLQKPLPARFAEEKWFSGLHVREPTLVHSSGGVLITQNAKEQGGYKSIYFAFDLRKSLRPLRERVVAHKKIFIAAAWAAYDTAVPGSFRRPARRNWPGTMRPCAICFSMSRRCGRKSSKPWKNSRIESTTRAHSFHRPSDFGMKENLLSKHFSFPRAGESVGYQQMPI